MIEDLAKTHYGEHADKPFFGSLTNTLHLPPSLAMVIEGEEAISTIRKLVGATNFLEADLGTLEEILLWTLVETLFML